MERLFQGNALEYQQIPSKAPSICKTTLLPCREQEKGPERATEKGRGKLKWRWNGPSKNKKSIKHIGTEREKPKKMSKKEKIPLKGQKTEKGKEMYRNETRILSRPLGIKTLKTTGRKTGGTEKFKHTERERERREAEGGGGERQSR